MRIGEGDESCGWDGRCGGSRLGWRWAKLGGLYVFFLWVGGRERLGKWKLEYGVHLLRWRFLEGFVCLLVDVLMLRLGQMKIKTKGRGRRMEREVRFSWNIVE